MLFRIRQLLHPIVRHPSLIRAAVDAELRHALDEMRLATPDNPCLSGQRVFSQNDEDGIIQEIFRRLGGGSTFIEIGCGDGLQNNTHFLLLKGWRGVWVDGNEKNVRTITSGLPANPARLRVVQRFINRDNIDDLAQDADLLSMDIDGNDLYVLQAFLKRCSPRVICAEYNPTFPPPMSIAIKYDEAHTWKGDMYYGASLQALVEGLGDYRLVGCNVTGTNAFFVRRDLAEPFTEYSVTALYRPAKPHLFITGTEQPPSFKFLAAALREHTPA